MSDIALIFLNGEPPVEQIIGKIDFNNVFVICADGAYDYLKKFCVPQILIGDMDSLSEKNIDARVRVEKFSPDKNYTDSELALRRAVELGFKRIEIYGAFGGRQDHEMVNYSLLALADWLGVEAVLKGKIFDVFFVTPQRPFKRCLALGKTVSLVPYSDKVHILSTKGLLFPAEDAYLDKIHIFTTSNAVCEETVEYCLSEGTALLFIQN